MTQYTQFISYIIRLSCAVLIKSGFPENEAKRLIGCVVSAEIFEVLKRREEFNLKRFVEALKKLPKLPWEE